MKKDKFVTCTVSLGKKELTSGRLRVVARLHEAEYCCSLPSRVRMEPNMDHTRQWQHHRTLWLLVASSCTLLIADDDAVTVSESWTHQRNGYQEFCPFALC